MKREEKSKAKELKNWPPTRKLAETGQAKACFDRIAKRKDHITGRTQRGKPIFGDREAIKLSGDPNNTSDEAEAILSDCLGVYTTMDSEVCLVWIDETLCVAEGFDKKTKKSVWGMPFEDPSYMISEVYKVFPKMAPRKVDQRVEELDKVSVQDLERALAKRQTEEQSKKKGKWEPKDPIQAHHSNENEKWVGTSSN